MRFDPGDYRLEQSCRCGKMLAACGACSMGWGQGPGSGMSRPPAAGSGMAMREPRKTPRSQRWKVKQRRLENVGLLEYFGYDPEQPDSIINFMTNAKEHIATCKDWRNDNTPPGEIWRNDKPVFSMSAEEVQNWQHVSTLLEANQAGLTDNDTTVQKNWRNYKWFGPDSRPCRRTGDPTNQNALPQRSKGKKETRFKIVCAHSTFMHLSFTRFFRKPDPSRPQIRNVIAVTITFTTVQFS